jgi:hypothetical protein
MPGTESEILRHSGGCEWGDRVVQVERMVARLDGGRQLLFSEVPCPRSGRRWRRVCGSQDVSWWLPAHAHAEAAGLNQDGTVQVQRGDRGPSGRRPAHDPVASAVQQKCSTQLCRRGSKRRTTSPDSGSSPGTRSALQSLQTRKVQARLASSVRPRGLVAMIGSGSWGNHASSSWSRQYSHRPFARSRTRLSAWPA